MLTLMKCCSCHFRGCEVPVEPPIPVGPPPDPVMWSAESTWAKTPEGFGGHGGGLPPAGSKVYIPAGK